MIRAHGESAVSNLYCLRISIYYQILFYTIIFVFFCSALVRSQRRDTPYAHWNTNLSSFSCCCRFELCGAVRVQCTCKVLSPKSIRLLAIKNKIENLPPNEIGSDAFAFTKLKSLEGNHFFDKAHEKRNIIPTMRSSFYAQKFSHSFRTTVYFTRKSAALRSIMLLKCDLCVLFFVSYQQKISRILQIILEDILHHSWPGSGSSNRNQK